jgi:hypothetical protein
MPKIKAKHSHSAIGPVVYNEHQFKLFLHALNVKNKSTITKMSKLPEFLNHALIYAIEQWQSAKVIQAILALGASPFASDSHDRSALWLALQTRNAPVIEALATREVISACVNKKTGYHALAEAFHYRNSRPGIYDLLWAPFKEDSLEQLSDMLGDRALAAAMKRHEAKQNLTAASEASTAATMSPVAELDITMTSSSPISTASEPASPSVITKPTFDPATLAKIASLFREAAQAYMGVTAAAGSGEKESFSPSHFLADW